MLGGTFRTAAPSRFPQHAVAATSPVELNHSREGRTVLLLTQRSSISADANAWRRCAEEDDLAGGSRGQSGEVAALRGPLRGAEKRVLMRLLFL
jgi:hypothetical protein